jgi:transcriptional regulator with XRE-family HTH domain
MANFLIIRDLCERKQITIRELAAKVGMQDISIHQLIKKGKTNTETLKKIADVLDVPVGIFFEETPNGNVSQNGKGNFVANSNNVTISECESKLEIAQNKISNLEALLEEKERLIQVLMKK